jgi:hypothetical protein
VLLGDLTLEDFDKGLHKGNTFAKNGDEIGWLSTV